MAIVFQTGFDHYTTVTQRATGVEGSGGTVTCSAGNGRNSTASLRITSMNNRRVSYTLPTALSTLYVGFAYRIVTNLPPVGFSYEICTFRNAGVSQDDMIVASDGLVYFRRVTADSSGGAVNTAVSLGMLSSFVMSVGVFYHFEIKLVISDTVGVVEVKVNEVTKLSLSSQDTQRSTSTITQVCLSGLGANVLETVDFDDLVVDDSAFAGDVQVRALLPTGTGTTDQWTAVGAATTREAVDESAPNDDTDYAEEATAGDITLHTYPDIPTTATVKAVCPLPYAKKTDAGTATMRSMTRISSSNYEGSDVAPSNASYSYLPHIWNTSPASAVAWTASEVNGAEFGFKRQT